MGSKLSKAARNATGTTASSRKPGAMAPPIGQDSSTKPDAMAPPIGQDSSTKPDAMARPHVHISEMADIKAKNRIAASTRNDMAQPHVKVSEMADKEAKDSTAAATRDCVSELLANVQAIKNDLELFEINAKGSIDSGAIDVMNELNVRAHQILSDLESVGINDKEGITAIAGDVRRELEAKFISIKEALERVGIDEHEGITSIAVDLRRELEANFIAIKEALERVGIEEQEGITSIAVDVRQELEANFIAIKEALERLWIEEQEGITSIAEDVRQELEANFIAIKEALEIVGIDEQEGITSISEDVRRELEANFIYIKEALERVGIDEQKGITSIAGDVRRELEANFIAIKEALERVGTKAINSIDDATESGVRKIELVTEENMRKIKTLNEKEYAHQRDEMLRAMMNHYTKKLSHVTTSPLNDWVQARLDDIYMPPNLQLMKKDKGSFMKTGTQITRYKNVFLTDGKLSRHTFIQGEAGSGKSTFLAKLIMDWCSAHTTKSIEPLPTVVTNSEDGNSPRRRTNLFKDLKTLTSYKFIFHVTLRDSSQEFEILEMIKQQIIDSSYSKGDRENAYKLLNEIMKRERCLVLLDGLDEWTGTGGHCLPVLASLSQCDMLITTRPWKMTQSKIPDSKIDTLLQLEGVNEPFEVSKILLACRGDFKESKDLDDTQSEFKSYVLKNGLNKLLVSPMLLSLIVQSWAEGTELKGSLCEIYSLLLESLLKKANSETSEFQRPPFRCFTWTQYIKPNNEHVDRLAEAAFYLLFSDKRENSLVFSITELKNSNSKLHEQEQLDFALKSGILSATRKGSLLRSSSAFSFIHKSLQEFLSAYHIARNTHLNLIDEVISGYLHRHKDAYLDISQVFIFLCGLDIMAANKLSGIMHERYTARVISRFDDDDYFCDIILPGYREAVANEQTNIALTLSHIDCYNDNMRDAHSVWKNNTLNLLSLNVCIHERQRPVPDTDSSPVTVESPSHIEFNLSSCHMLKSLHLACKGIWLKDSFSTARSEDPVWIVLDSANPAQCADPPPVLPSIETISLFVVKCSSTWLRNLFSMLLTLDHQVICELVDSDISCVDGALKRESATIRTDVNNTFSLFVNRNTGDGLWEALHGQYIKCLSISGLNEELMHLNEESLFESVQSLPQLETLNIDMEVNDDIFPYLWEALNSLNIKRVTLSLNSVWCGLIVNNVSMLSQALLSNNMETICIYLNEQPCMMEAVHGLPIKSLSLYGSGESLEMNHVSSLYKLLSTLKQLEQLSVFVNNDSVGLWEALHGLNIKSLSLNDGDLNHVSSLSHLLSSLSQLETCYIKVNCASHPDLWNALRGLNFKSLSLNGLTGGRMKHMKTLSLLFPSLTLLETLRIGVDDDISGLSEALRGMYIKSLCLSGSSGSMKVHNAELFSQSLSSLTQLETLTLYVAAYIDLQLPQSLKYFNFYCTEISPLELRDLVKTLSACTQTVESKLEFGCAIRTHDHVSHPEIQPIRPEEYIPIQRELTAQNITVKRFRILNRKSLTVWFESADSSWSVRDNVVVEKDDYDDGIVDDDTYNLFVRHLDNYIVNRMSMRLQCYAASNA